MAKFLTNFEVKETLTDALSHKTTRTTYNMRACVAHRVVYRVTIVHFGTKKFKLEG